MNMVGHDHSFAYGVAFRFEIKQSVCNYFRMSSFTEKAGSHPGVQPGFNARSESFVVFHRIRLIEWWWVLLQKCISFGDPCSEGFLWNRIGKTKGYEIAGFRMDPMREATR